MPSFLTPHDKAVCDTRGLRVLIRRPTSASGSETVRRDLLFQFPPRITNDSRDGEWDEKSAGPNSGDKIAVFKSANPRRITMEWKYISGYANWSVSKIKEQIKLVRGYFRNPFIEGDDDDALSPLVVFLLLWDIGGDGFMSFRMASVSVKHGNTLIGKKPVDTFPLYTEISAEFKSWPSIGDPPAQTVPGQIEFGLDWF